MIWLSLKNSDSYPIRIDDPEGTTKTCLASQSDTPCRNAFSSFGAGRRWGDFWNRSRVRRHAQSPRALNLSRARVP